MNKKFWIIALSISFLLSISLISATCASVGKVNATTYCDVDGTYKLLKNNNANCANDFECKIESCYYAKCQTKYAPLTPVKTNINLLQRIWDFIQGIECYRDVNPDKCEGYDYFVCSAQETWEAKGRVVGKCEWHANSCTLENAEKCEVEILYLCEQNSSGDLIWVNKGNVNGKCGYTTPCTGNCGGGGGGGCTSNWVCTAWSNTAKQCGTRTCTDTNHCGRVLDTKIYPIVKTCPSTPTAYCGDGECNGNEDETICPEDCVTYYCGDGNCDVDEDSNSCPEDCEAPLRHDYRWLFWIIIIILLIAIIVVAYLLYKNLPKSKKVKKMQTITKTNFGMQGKPLPVMKPALPPTKPQPKVQPKPFISPIFAKKPETKEVKEEKMVLDSKPLFPIRKEDEFKEPTVFGKLEPMKFEIPRRKPVIKHIKPIVAKKKPVVRKKSPVKKLEIKHEIKKKPTTQAKKIVHHTAPKKQQKPTLITRTIIEKSVIKHLEKKNVKHNPVTTRTIIDKSVIKAKRKK